MNSENMTAQNKKSTSWIEIVENFEKLVFYTSLLAIPLSIIPLPWDLTEFSMGLTLIFFSTILLTLELVKLIWKGRLLIPKAIIDVGILGVLASITISSAFSVSFPSSLWGFDFRLGSGLVATLLAALYIYSARSFLFKYEEVVNGSVFFIIGTFLTAIFSIFSFFGFDILSFSATFNNLFTAGLPLYSSSRISVVIWGVSLLLSIYLSAVSFNEKKLPFVFFTFTSVLVHLIAITLFSLAQGWMFFGLVFAMILAFCVYIGIKGKTKTSKSFPVVLYSLLGLVTVFFVLSLIPFVRNGIGSVSKTLITQITISGDTSLKIVTQTLSQNVLRSLVGMGHDTFSIAYNQFRPLNDQTVVVNSTNFTNANNQIFNILTNRGLIGFGVWILLGYFIFKYLLENFKMNKLDSEQAMTLLAFDLIIVYLYLSSFLVYQTFLIYFLFLFAIGMSVLIRSMIFKDKLDVYVLNLGMFTHTSGNVGVKNTTFAITAIIVIAGLLFNVWTIRIGISALNALNAEKITAIARNKGDSLGEAEKDQVLIDAANMYATAIRYNPKNDVLHRRAAVIISQYLESLATQYNKTDDDASKKKLFDQLATYVEISVEESKNATEIAPKVYANWAVRSNVYSKLVGLGLTSYTKSALSALQNGASLNPLNYEVYYNAAQLYILNNESDSALRTLNQLFSINPDHIPSLILAGEISFKDKDYKQSQRYFTDAKKVMEESNSTTNDVYDYVVKKLEELEPLAPKATTPVKTDDSKKNTTTNTDKPKETSTDNAQTQQ